MQNRIRISTAVSPAAARLAVLWCTALLLGGAVGWQNAGSWTPVLRHAAGCSVHGFSCLLSAAAGIFLTAAAGVLIGRAGVWLICPVQAFLLGALAAAAGCCWRSGGFLIAGMLLFSPLLISSVLLMLWQWMLRNSRAQFLRAVLIGLCAALGIAAAGVFVVSPFLMEVIYF